MISSTIQVSTLRSPATTVSKASLPSHQSTIKTTVPSISGPLPGYADLKYLPPGRDVYEEEEEDVTKPATDSDVIMNELEEVKTTPSLEGTGRTTMPPTLRLAEIQSTIDALSAELASLPSPHPTRKALYQLASNLKYHKIMHEGAVSFGTSPTDHVQRQPHQQLALHSTPPLTEMDRRIRQMEECIGIQQLQQLPFLTGGSLPNHLSLLASRLSLLETALLSSASTASEGSVSEGNGLESLNTVGGSLFGRGSSSLSILSLNKKLDTIYATIQKIEPWVDAIPTLIDRYALAAELLHDAASFATDLQDLQQAHQSNQDMVALLTKGMRDLKETVHHNEQVMSESGK